MAFRSAERQSMGEVAWAARCAARKAARTKASIARRPEENKKYHQVYYQKNKAKYAARTKAWVKANRPKVNAYKRKARVTLPAVKAQAAAWRAANPDKVKATELRTKQKRSDPVYKAARVARNSLRRKTDPHYALEMRLRSRLCSALKAKGAKKNLRLGTLLGCTIQEFKAYLESLFLPGMTWEKRSLWHIDHKRPCASFDLTDVEQQKACFHYTNLQPLWAADNLKKKDKWESEAA